MIRSVKVYLKLKTSLTILSAMLIFASFNVCAELVTIPVLKARVTDLTQTLTAEQQSQLEAKLTAFEQQKGSQIAVLIVPTTQPEDIAQYSIRVTDVWKLGRKKQDDGILILVAKNDHKMRIEVGRGLEGAIPDLYAKRIITENIAPLFKQGDTAGGLNAGIDKLIGLISGENLPPPPQKQQRNGMGFENSLGLFLMLSMVCGAFLTPMLGRLFGSGATATIIAGIFWLIAGTLGMAILTGVMAFIFTMVMPWLFNHLGGVGLYTGASGSGSGGFSRDIFSGGGGGFGGGGASGDW